MSDGCEIRPGVRQTVVIGIVAASHDAEINLARGAGRIERYSDHQRAEVDRRAGWRREREWKTRIRRVVAGQKSRTGRIRTVLQAGDAVIAGGGWRRIGQPFGRRTRVGRHYASGLASAFLRQFIAAMRGPGQQHRSRDADDDQGLD